MAFHYNWIPHERHFQCIHLTNEEIHSLNRSSKVRAIKSRRLGWTEHVARMKESRSAFKTLTDKPTGKRTLGRTKRKWEDSIIIDLKYCIYANLLHTVLNTVFTRIYCTQS